MSAIRSCRRGMPAILIVTAVLVLAMVVVATAGAQGRRCHPGHYSVEAQPISDGSGAAQAPATDGELAVWADDRSGDLDIFARNIASGEEWTVCAVEGDQCDPVVAGGRIYWVDRSGESPSVWTWDPEAETAVQVAANADQVAAGEGYVAWVDRSGAGADIVALNRETGEVFTVCAAGGDQVRPTVSSYLIAWEDYRNGSEADIFAYDLGSGVEFPVNEAAGNQTAPSAYGGVIVWADDRCGGSDIYGADLSKRWVDPGDGGCSGALPGRGCVTEGEFAVCAAHGDQVEPVICGPMVYWTDLAPGEEEADIVGVALTWGDPFAVCEDCGPQTSPAAGGDGELVVWVDGAGDVPVICGGPLVWNEGDTGDEPGVVDEWTTDDVITVFLGALSDLGAFDEVRFAVDDGAFGDWQSLDDTEAVQLPAHDGAHVIHIQLANSVFAAGAIGSEDNPLEVDVTTTLDTTGPVTAAPRRLAARRGAAVTLKVKVRDNLSPTATVQVRIKNRAGKVVRIVNLGEKATGQTISQRWKVNLKRGRYTYRVVARDLAGNPQRRAGANVLIVR